MATATKRPATTTCYYLATCGSIYRVRTVTGGSRTENGTWQARRTKRAAEFEHEYYADSDEVAQAVRRGAFTLTTKP
ncbi:hypothetical protein ACFQ48_16870 [Hymenobacter caeli]|uniref:DUF2188 domain-containing protein n=1 Tax=Hymenobacter caeli TaxID=2735894 RepID=A0ABX2FQJ2_9BACT|nr:hypothetical protein [Hymenobacter caeli]NRT19379.1 hypothetical protein [Hymenobacter caeli]